MSEPGSRARHRAWKSRGISAPPERYQAGINPIDRLRRALPHSGACTGYGCSDLSRSTARQRCSGPVTASSSRPSPCVRASGWTPRPSPRRCGARSPPASAAKVVQGCVSRLRKALGADAIETVDGGYRVRSDELDIDRQQFEDQVERARGYLATRTPERAIPLLTDALALWRGPAFGELEDWMPGRLEAVRLGQLRLAAEEDLLQARLDCGDHAGVAADGTVLTGQQPFRERRWALLALAQYRSGRQADALASIRSARRALGQELGLDPGSELVALESRILAQDPGLATDHEARIGRCDLPVEGTRAVRRPRRRHLLRARRRHRGLPGPVGGVPAARRHRTVGVRQVLAGAGRAGAGPAGRGRGGGGVHPGSRRCAGHGGGPQPARRGPAARHRPVRGDLHPERGDASRDRGWASWLATPRSRRRSWWSSEATTWRELGADVGARPAGRARPPPRRAAGRRPLREAVEGPAKVAGLRLEPGLVDLIVRDADGQPGALPLMSHALAETWRRREAGLLTVDGYRAVRRHPRRGRGLRRARLRRAEPRPSARSCGG